MSLIIISDIHLGRYKYGKLNPKTSLDLRTEDILSNIDQTLKFAVDNNVKYFFILGDLYHLKRPLEVFRKAIAQKIHDILENGKIELFIILGNHDQGKTAAHDLVELYQMSRLIDHFNVIDSPQIINREENLFCFLPHVNQIEHNISNEDFFKYQIDQIQNLTKEAKKSDKKYKFFFGHFGTDQSIVGESFDLGSSGKSARVIPIKIFDESIWTKVYLGDIHKTQEMNDFCRHVGSIAKVDFNEEFEEKGFYYFNQGKDSFIKFNDRQFKTLECDLVTKDPRKKMANFCDEIQEIDLSQSIVRLKIKIKENDKTLINFKAIEEYLKEVSWNYIGKMMIEIRKENEDISISENNSLDYIEIFHDYIQHNKLQIDEKNYDDVLNEGESILSEILNRK